MAKTYEQIAKQIESLKLQADALKRKEAVGVAARIRDAIAFYGLTPQDLGFAGSARKSADKSSAAPATVAGKRAGRKKSAPRPSVIRFRNVDGRTWTGMGRKPAWLTDGLAAGKTLADFAVPSAGTDLPA